jgi:transcriptional regulator with XRE-family HTH domain
MDQQDHRYETFGSVLRRIRQSKHLTQRDVARRLKMDFAYFSRLETDRLTGLPMRETITKIAKAMKCTAMETAELLAAAGRVSEEMQTRPELRRLFRTAAQLPSSVLEELVQEAEDRLKQQSETPRKRRKNDDASSRS